MLLEVGNRRALIIRFVIGTLSMSGQICRTNGDGDLELHHILRSQHREESRLKLRVGIFSSHLHIFTFAHAGQWRFVRAWIQVKSGNLKLHHISTFFALHRPLTLLSDQLAIAIILIWPEEIESWSSHIESSNLELHCISTIWFLPTRLTDFINWPLASAYDHGKVKSKKASQHSAQLSVTLVTDD